MRPRTPLEAVFASVAGSLHPLDAGRAQVALVRTCDWLAWRDDASALLDDNERLRVSRQRRPHDRDSRTLAYGMHRLLLAHALGCAPAEVPLYRDAGGCPRLVGDVAWTSLSHADGWLAFAVSGSGAIGVDIEPASRGGAIEVIAADICRPDEWRRMSAWPVVHRASALLDTWVRKEAVLKAVGVGLEVPMASFDASGPLPVRVPGHPGGWRIARLDAGPDAMAAVAVREGTQVACVRLGPAEVAAAPALAPDEVRDRLNGSRDVRPNPLPVRVVYLCRPYGRCAGNAVAKNE